jgi:hypothetical protein
MSRKRRHSSRAKTRSGGRWKLPIAVLCVLLLTAVWILHQRNADTARSAIDKATTVRFLPTIANHNSPLVHPPEGMVWIPGGEFSKGAQDSPKGSRSKAASRRLAISLSAILTAWKLSSSTGGKTFSTRIREDRQKHNRHGHAAHTGMRRPL